MVEGWVHNILIGVALILGGGLGLTIANYMVKDSSIMWLPYTIIGIGFAIVAVSIYQKIR